MNKRAATVFMSVLLVLMPACGGGGVVDAYGRRELIVAAFDNVGLLNKLAVEFNKSNERYFVTIDDYGPGVDGDYRDSLRQFDAAIMAGSSSRYPDIVVTTSDHYARLAHQGAFADLTPYLEADERYDRENMFEKVLDALLMDGKQYGMAVDFAPHILLMNNAGAALELSLESMVKLQREADYPVSGILDLGENLVYWLLAYLDEFIDWETGTCDFDDPRFLALVEMTADYPQTSDLGSFAEAALENEPIFMNCQLDSFYKLQAIINLFDGEMTISGFPESEGEVKALFANIFSITANSRQKAAAWDFISGCLDEEFQMANIDNRYFCLPVSKRVFDEYVARHSEEIIYMQRAWIRETVSFGDEVYEMTRLHEDTIDTYLRMLDMDISGASAFPQTLADIIGDEIYLYIYEGKPKELMIDAINNRTSLYLKEIK